MENFEPVIVAFCCHYCAYTAADMAGSKRLCYPPNVKIVRVPCSGKVDAIHIMKALEMGADGVYVAGCLEGDCHFKNGNINAAKRVAYVKKLLDEIGIMACLWPVSTNGKTATEKIRKLGPNPAKSISMDMASNGI